MTDDEVFKILAKRQFNKEVYPCSKGTTGWCYASNSRARALPDYLVSRDSLTPILERLNQAERNTLIDNIVDQACDGTTGDMDFWFLLTIPPRDLAFAIAEVIGRGHE